MKKKVDMSEQAILRRLKTVDRLRTLCLSLMKAKKVSDKKQAKLENKQTFTSQIRSNSSSSANGARAKKTV